MLMRSDVEIRREVEARLRRRGWLMLDGGGWIAAVVLLALTMPNNSFGTSLVGLILVSMLAWTGVLGLHVLRTLYVEVREWMVRRAIDQEYQMYRIREAVEKHKRDDAAARLSSDGELVDFPEELTWRKGRE